MTYSLVYCVFILTVCTGSLAYDCDYEDKEGYGITADTRLYYQLVDTYEICEQMCETTEACTVFMYQRFGCHLLQRPLLHRIVVDDLEACKDECESNDECQLLQLVHSEYEGNVCWLYSYSDIKKTIYFGDIVSVKSCKK